MVATEVEKMNEWCASVVFTTAYFKAGTTSEGNELWRGVEEEYTSVACLHMRKEEIPAFKDKLTEVRAYMTQKGITDAVWWKLMVDNYAAQTRLGLMADVPSHTGGVGNQRQLPEGLERFLWP